jgi:hypothetical protein
MYEALLRIQACCVALALFCSKQVGAQDFPFAAQEFPFRIRGDVSGAPPGCSARAGFAAINNWFVAFNNADSAQLDQATAPRFVFSRGAFTRTQSFVVTHDIRTLVRYARNRAGRHEHLRIQEVMFNGWRGRGLEFGPIYFLRSADDLGPTALPGIGKGEFVCEEGIHVLNLGPRPAFDPWPKQ